MMPGMVRSARIADAGPALAHDPCVLLGVDPGLRRSGYALLASDSGRPAGRLLEAGVIRLDFALALESRLLELDSNLDALIDRHRPAVLACEQLYAHYKHPRTAILMAHARGVILALAARRGLRIVHVEATRAKKLLTGSGHASKPQMQRAVAALFGLEALPEPHDVADAIAIACCGMHLRGALQVTSGIPVATAPARRTGLRSVHVPGSDG